MPEAQETAEFWKYLGGKGEYASGLMYEVSEATLCCKNYLFCLLMSVL